MFEIEIYVGHFLSTSLKKPHFFTSCAITLLLCLIHRDTEGYLTFLNLCTPVPSLTSGHGSITALFYVKSEAPARKASCAVIGRAICVCVCVKAVQLIHWGGAGSVQSQQQSV